MRVIGNIASDSEVVATASGAITAGKPVVVNADGTVQFAGQSTVSTTIGSANTFTSAAILGTDITFDSNSNRVVISYRDGGNSDYGTAIVGEVNASNNTISFGTPVVFESAATNFTSIDFDSTANKVLIAYEDDANSDYGTAIVGTVDSSDNSISFGSAAVFESAAVQYLTTRFDPDNSKFLIVYEDNGNSDYGTAVVATISGTSVSFGTPTVYASVSTVYNTCIYDTNANKFLVVYRNADVGGYGIVATISGTSVSFGSATGFHTSGSSIFINGSTGRFGTSFDSTLNKIVIAYQAYPISSSTVGYVVVGTISGTSVSFGSYVALGAAEDDHANIIAYDSSTKKHLLMNYDASEDPDHTNIREITVSGTTPTVGDQVLVSDLRESTNNAIVFDSNAKKMVIAYAFGGNSNYGTANVIQTSGTVDNLTSENFIGFAKDNVADGAVATIQTANSIARDNIRDTTTSDTLGSEVGLGQNIANEDSTSMTFDSSNNKVVVFYVNASGGDTKTVVGTVTDNSISFGTPATFTDAQYSVNALSCVFDSNENKVVFAYVDTGDSNKGKAVVGTVSGTSISFGSEVEFESGRPYTLRGTFDSNSNRVVFVYRDSNNSNYFTSVVGSVSGSSISFGTPVVIASAYYTYWDITFDSNSNKVVVGLKGASSHGQSYVGTVDSSDNSITWGNVATFHSSANPRYIGATFDTNANKVVFSYMADDDSDKGYAVVGTVSGTDISFGTPTKFEDAAVKFTSIVFNSATNKVVVVYEDDANSDYTTYAVGTVSGTDISFDTAVVVSQNDANEGTSIVFDSNSNKVVMQYGHSSDGKFRVLDVAGGLTDLTIGQTYFVQTDGTLSTSADSPSVIAGTAISGTDLIVKG